MTKKTYDIVVVGGGMVGLCFAAACATHFKVALCEHKQPDLQWQPDDLTARVSALNQASLNILANLEVLPEIQAECLSNLMRLNVWDGVSGSHVEFDAADIGAERLGIIAENRAIVRALWQQLKAKVDYYIATPQQILHHQHHVELVTDKEKLAATLIVGADGANSWVRQQTTIQLKKRPYRQRAIVAVLQTEKSHQQAAWQRFLTTGPLGVLPLADSHQVAIVWSAEENMTDKLLALDQAALDCEVMNALELKLGQMQLLNKPIAIPLIMRHAQQYSCDRVVLIGDAAHTIHPLAGQGVNLGFMDAACLAECLMAASEQGYDIGTSRPLRRYERWRKADNQLMLLAMRSFKEVFATSVPLIVQLRSFGFNATNRLSVLKRCFARYAVGQVADCPALAKQAEFI